MIPGQCETQGQALDSLIRVDIAFTPNSSAEPLLRYPIERRFTAVNNYFSCGCALFCHRKCRQVRCLAS